MAKYDSWTRKYVEAHSEFGFEKKEGKKTSHQNWEYNGPKTKHPVVTTIVPSIQNKARRDAISGIKRKLVRAGARKEDLGPFDRLALGLIQVMPTDTVADIEEKLEEAVSRSWDLDAVRIGIELGKRIASEGISNYTCKPLVDRQAIIDHAEQSKHIREKINKIIEQIVRQGLDEYIEENQHFIIGGCYYRDREMSELPKELCERYGFDFVEHKADTDERFIIIGEFRGKLEKIFYSRKIYHGFSIQTDNDGGESVHYCDESDRFENTTVPIRYDLPLTDLQEILKELENIRVQMALGMHQVSD